MNTDPKLSDLPAVELIRDPDAAAVLLKPPRPALLAALRQPASASGLARRLGLPRQRLNHHLRELERCGFIKLLEKRRRGNFTERILRASARRYLICPEVLGELGTFAAEDLREPHAWTSLAAMSAQTLSELATLRQQVLADPPTLTVPNRLRFASAETLNAFYLELAEQLGRLVRKYHDETSGTPYRFVLGAYPASPESVDRESGPAEKPGMELAADDASSTVGTNRDLEGRRPARNSEWIRRWAPKLGKALARTIHDPEPLETTAGEDALLSEEELLDSLHDVAEKMLASLQLREQVVLGMRFGIGGQSGYPVKDVASSLAVSPGRIQQIQSKGLRQLCEIHPAGVRQFLRQLRLVPET